MNSNERVLVDVLKQAVRNLSYSYDLSDEALSLLLPIAAVLVPWLGDARDEALQRARAGTRFDGFVLKAESRRRVSDPDAALEAIRACDPSLVPLCQKTALVGIRELKKLLGKDRFETLIGPFVVESVQYNLRPGEESE